MSDEHQIEAAVTAYRAQLEAEADIGRSDLAEIEDRARAHALGTERRTTAVFER